MIRTQHLRAWNAVPARGTVKRITFSAFARSVAACLGAALLIHADVVAATKTWTGAGTTANWSAAANWNPSGAPVNGDTLIFPASAARLINTNNLTGLRVASVSVTDDGYSLRGNGLTVSNGLVFSYTSGVVSVWLDLTLGANQTFDNRGPFTSISGDINLNGFNLTADGQDAGELFLLSGAITGAGNVTITGAGQVAFQGGQANTYSGTTTVNGTLTLGKSAGVNAVPQALIVPEGGTVEWVNGDQLPDSALVNVIGSLDLKGKSETVGPLDLQDASIATGTGVLTLNGGVTNRASSFASIITGTLHLGNFTRAFVVGNGTPAADLLVAASVRGGAFGLPGSQTFAGVTKLGEGALVFSASNSFAGVLSIQSGELRALNNDSLGSTNGGTTVSSNASLVFGSLLSIEEPLTLAGHGTGGTNGALRQLAGTTSDSAAVTLGGSTLIVVEDGGVLTLSGVVSGTGPLVKVGAGDLYLSGASGNTFTGGASLLAGATFLNKSAGNAVPGDASVGAPGVFIGPTTPARLRQLRADQIGGSVTVNSSGTWDLNGHDEGILDLFLNGGANVTTGNGRLLMRDITATPDPLSGEGSSIAGFLELSASAHTFTLTEGTGSGDADPPELEISASIIGGGGFTKTGAGDLWLTSSNTFLGIATVNQGELRVGKDLALGSTFSGTRVLGSGVLSLIQKEGAINYGGVRVSNEVLELDSVGEIAKGVLHCTDHPAIWSGQVTLHRTTIVNVTTNTTYEDWATLRLDGNVSGPGGIIKTGPGALLFINFGVNDYAGATMVTEGTVTVARLANGGGIPGPLVVGDGSGGTESAIVNLGVDAGVYFNQVRADQPVVVNGDGLLRFQVRSSSSLSSLTGNGRLEIMAADQVTLGVGDSSYTFDGKISGLGKLAKTGTGTVTLNGDNTLTGETSASLGKLVINGMHVGSKVVVNTVGQLGGDGQLGDLTVFPSTRLVPGASPGRLSANNVDLWANSNFELEFDGPEAGTGYDQLYVINSASVSNSILRMAMNYLPANGQVFKIIDKFGPGPVLGTFANGGEGTIFNLNGVEAVLSYVGGDGNDVTLTVTNRFWEFQSAVVTMGNGNGYIDPNECNHLTVFIRNIWPGLGISATNIRLDSDTPGIIITSQEWGSGIIQPGTLLSNTKPIQFRTTPELQCGTWADFSLTLTTGSPLRIPFRIFIPAAGGFFAYNLTGSPQPIPDGGIVSSTIEVPGNVSLLNVDRVLVGVHATHPRVSDLRLRLITPGGRNVLLSANRGGNGVNYGNGCAFADFTFFSDSAATAISSAVAPFVGQFRPEQPLAVAQGEPLTGTWQLVAEDTVTGQTGTLECWRLHLIPPFCRDAGGGCEPCGGPVAGTLGASQMPARLRLTGETPSVCGWTSQFPGTNAAPGPYRYATHLFTNTGPATCVSVLLKNTCANTNSALMVSAYTNFFDPGNIVTNYAGDTALSNVLTGQFAFRVASNQVFAVVVNDTQPAASSTCSSYTLEIFGLPCPPPPLEIARDAGSDKVRMSWSTAYPAHQLEGAPALTALPAFATVSNVPAVVAGRYTITNTTSAGQGHYRLRKP